MDQNIDRIKIDPETNTYVLASYTLNKETAEKTGRLYRINDQLDVIKKSTVWTHGVLSLEQIGNGYSMFGCSDGIVKVAD